MSEIKAKEDIILKVDPNFQTETKACPNNKKHECIVYSQDFKFWNPRKKNRVSGKYIQYQESDINKTNPENYLEDNESINELCANIYKSTLEFSLLSSKSENFQELVNDCLFVKAFVDRVEKNCTFEGQVTNVITERIKIEDLKRVLSIEKLSLNSQDDANIAGWLNDENMNFVSDLINIYQCVEYEDSVPKVVVVPPAIYNRQWKKPMYGNQEYQKIKDWIVHPAAGVSKAVYMSRDNQIPSSYVVLCNPSKIHWITYHISIRNNSNETFDSQKSSVEIVDPYGPEIIDHIETINFAKRCAKFFGLLERWKFDSNVKKSGIYFGCEDVNNMDIDQEGPILRLDNEDVSSTIKMKNCQPSGNSFLQKCQDGDIDIVSCGLFAILHAAKEVYRKHTEDFDEASNSPRISTTEINHNQHFITRTRVNILVAYMRFLCVDSNFVERFIGSTEGNSVSPATYSEALHAVASVCKQTYTEKDVKKVDLENMFVNEFEYKEEVSIVGKCSDFVQSTFKPMEQNKNNERMSYSLTKEPCSGSFSLFEPSDSLLSNYKTESNLIDQFDVGDVNDQLLKRELERVLKTADDETNSGSSQSEEPKDSTSGKRVGGNMKQLKSEQPKDSTSGKRGGRHMKQLKNIKAIKKRRTEKSDSEDENEGDEDEFVFNMSIEEFEELRKSHRRSRRAKVKTIKYIPDSTLCEDMKDVVIDSGKGYFKDDGTSLSNSTISHYLRESGNGIDSKMIINIKDSGVDIITNKIKSEGEIGKAMTNNAMNLIDDLGIYLVCDTGITHSRNEPVVVFSAVVNFEAKFDLIGRNEFTAATVHLFATNDNDLQNKYAKYGFLNIARKASESNLEFIYIMLPKPKFLKTKDGQSSKKFLNEIGFVYGTGNNNFFGVNIAKAIDIYKGTVREILEKCTFNDTPQTLQFIFKDPHCVTSLGAGYDDWKPSEGNLMEYNKQIDDSNTERKQNNICLYARNPAFGWRKLSAHDIESLRVDHSHQINACYNNLGVYFKTGLGNRLQSDIPKLENSDVILPNIPERFHIGNNEELKSTCLWKSFCIAVHRKNPIMSDFFHEYFLLKTKISKDHFNYLGIKQPSNHSLVSVLNDIGGNCCKIKGLFIGRLSPRDILQEILSDDFSSLVICTVETQDMATTHVIAIDGTCNPKVILDPVEKKEMVLNIQNLNTCAGTEDMCRGLQDVYEIIYLKNPSKKYKSFEEKYRNCARKK